MPVEHELAGDDSEAGEVSLRNWTKRGIAAASCNSDARATRYVPAVRAASSDATDPEQSIAELFDELDPSTLAGVVLFCSCRYDVQALARAIAKRSDGLTVVGCTTAGEITPDGLREGTITAVGFPSDDFTFSAVRFDALGHFNMIEADRRVRALVADAAEASRHFGSHPSRAAIFLVDGFSHREEMLAFSLQDALGDIPLIGGSSCGGLFGGETFILHEGAFHRDAALVAVLTSRRRMHVFRSHYYTPGNVKMVVTGASPGDRIVYEINAEPAAEAYARLLGMPVEDVGPSTFAAHPPMMQAGGEYYCRSIQGVNPDRSLTFSCAIDEGIVLTLGQANDILGTLGDLFEELNLRSGEIDRVLGFDCILNSVEIGQRQLRPQVSELFARNRVVGFNTYGEQFHALHVNQNFCGLVIGR